MSRPYKVNITVSGHAGSGRTCVAIAIEKALKELKVDDIEFECPDFPEEDDRVKHHEKVKDMSHWLELEVTINEIQLPRRQYGGSGQAP